MNPPSKTGFRPWIAAALMAISMTGRVAFAASDSAKDDAKWRLATLAAARQILDDLNRTDPFSGEERLLLVESLNDAMRQDMAAHARRDDSRKLCSDIASRLRRQTIEQRIQAAIQRAGEQSPLPVNRNDVVTLLGNDWTHKMEQTVQSFASQALDPIFQDARVRAIGLVRQDVERKVRFPTCAEIDTLLSEFVGRHPSDLHLSSDDEKALEARIVAMAIPDDKPCFEELRTAVTDRVRRITGEIRKQYDRQLTLLDQAEKQGVPADKRQKAAILQAIQGTLETDLTRERAKPSTADSTGTTIPIYDVFASVKTRIPLTAAQLEEQRFRSFLEGTPVMALDSDTLAKQIRANPEKHVTPRASRELLQETWATSFRKQAAMDYAAGATPAGQSDYFADLLMATNGTIPAAFHSRISGELERHLPEARQTVSNEQFEKYFRAFESKAPLSPASLSRLEDTGGAAITTLDEALKIFQVSMSHDKPILEEASNRAVALANQKAREGYDVLTSQLAMVRKVEQERMDKLRQNVASRRPFREIRREWQSAAETAWQQDPRAKSTPYNELVEQASTALNKAVRQLYDALQENPNVTIAQAIPESRTPTEAEQGKVKELKQDPAHPEEQSAEKKKVDQPLDNKPSPAAAGHEGATDTVLSRIVADRRNEPDGVLLLTGSAGHPCTARLISSYDGEGQAITFSPGKIQAASDTIFKAIKPRLETIWLGTVNQWQKDHSGLGVLKRRTPPKVKLYVVIESDDVRHRMSLLLRQHIDEAFQEWYDQRGKGTPDVELDWKVGLTFDPESKTR